MDANEVGSQKLVEPFKKLPEETILEIFGKLPLRDLMVFRCVSKFWCFQIDTNPDFVRMTKNNFSLMIIEDDKRVGSLDNNTLSSSLLLDGIEGHFKKIHCPLAPLGWNLERTNFVGSCNGLFFMYNEDKEQICLWNPCTNETRFLPTAEFQPGAGFLWIKDITLCILDVGYGFGYDSKSDDYKYVRIFRYNCSESPSVVDTYSFRTDTWKKIYAVVHWEREMEPNGVFCNGALHWFVRNISTYYPKVLLALDMTEGGVREIPQPENLDIKKFGTNKYVDVLDGCLCILYSNSAGFQVWVMKDYGMRESWTIMYNISELKILHVESFVYLRRIECLKTGEILLEVHYDSFTTAALVLYDPKNETASVLKLHKNSWRSKLGSLFCRYLKSLVKLNSETYVGTNEQERNDLQKKALSIRD